MTSAVAWMERWQIPLYLGAIVLAATVGLAVPAVGLPLSHAINPVLGLPHRLLACASQNGIDTDRSASVGICESATDVSRRRPHDDGGNRERTDSALQKFAKMVFHGGLEHLAAAA